MLYRTLKRMIERGQIEGMEEKLDIFPALLSSVGRCLQPGEDGGHQLATLLAPGGGGSQTTVSQWEDGIPSSQIYLWGNV